MSNENQPKRPGDQPQPRRPEGDAVNTILNFLGGFHADQAHAPFLGYIAALISLTPPERWAEMVRASARPCGRPGCDCHVGGRASMLALDEFHKKFRGRGQN